MHLIIDGYGDDPEILQDESFLYQLLDSYPARIGMTKIAPPHILKYVGNKPEDWGISGIVIIAESHISVHTFVARRYVNIDVFSCNDFDAEKVVEDFQDKLRLTKLRSFLVNRDLSVPHLVENTKVVGLHSL